MTRYRECPACKTRWRTREQFEHLVSIEGKSTRPDRVRDGSLHNVSRKRRG